jgi:uncharacterized protein involved in tolerance to divalent cations
MSTGPDDFVVVLVTTASAEEARRIGRALVEERLAGCVNVLGPIRSIWRCRWPLGRRTTSRGSPA